MNLKPFPDELKKFWSLPSCKFRKLLLIYMYKAVDSADDVWKAVGHGVTS